MFLLKTKSSKQLKQLQPILKLMCLNQQILKWQGQNGQKKSSNCSKQVCTEVVNFSEQQKVTNLEEACQPIANLRYIKTMRKKKHGKVFLLLCFLSCVSQLFIKILFTMNRNILYVYWSSNLD